MPKRDQAERLLLMLELLSRGRRLDSLEVRGDMNVSGKTFYRDMRRLKELGYPLESTSDDDSSCFYFKPNWGTGANRVLLSLPQIESILLAVEQHCRIGPPNKRVRSALAKLHALHSEAAPPARVRAWRAIVQPVPSPAPPLGIMTETLRILTEAISERRWCDLEYLAVGEESTRSLIFAPAQLSDAILLGKPRDFDRWEMIDVARIVSATATNDYFPVEFLQEPENPLSYAEDTSEPERELQQAAEAERLARTNEQILRLIGIARMLQSGREPNRTELAAAFETTLTTIRRDLALLECTGYSVRMSDCDSQLIKGGSVFGTVPLLACDAAERTALVHLLERFQLHNPVQETLASAIAALTSIPANQLVALTVLASDGIQPEPDEVFWSLVNAIVKQQPITVLYNAHWSRLRHIEFFPESFQTGNFGWRIRGPHKPTGELVALQIKGIIRVRPYFSVPGAVPEDIRTNARYYKERLRTL